MRIFLLFFVVITVFYSCKTTKVVFGKKTDHEQYEEKLNKAELKQTAMGGKWFEMAEKSLLNAIPVELPYQESDYFSADRPDATGIRFNAKTGELLTIELVKIPASDYLLFADLFIYTNGTTKYIQSIDTTNNLLRYVVKESSSFVLRLQPELLKNGSYIISIKTGPSLAFPVLSPGPKNHIISFWGDGRDKGTRKHEGVDIGGAFRTPVVAVGDGVISRVTENNLGGKVVFISADNSNESWYYAHLDSQIVVNGQRVKAGDIVGLMGNTGNAKNTVTHLHFGIYTFRGAIDPLPFINPIIAAPKKIVASTAALGKQFYTTGKNTVVYLTPDLKYKEKVAENIPVLMTAATANLYKVVLPGGETRFIAAANVVPPVTAEKYMRKIKLKEKALLMDAPIAGSPVIQSLDAGTDIGLLGGYGKFRYIRTGDKYGWISQ